MSKYRNSQSSPDEPPPVRISGESLREAARLFAYLLPYRRKFVAAMICLMLSSLTGLAFPYFTGRLIDSTHGAVLALQSGSSWPVASLNINTVALVLLVVLAVQACCNFFQTYWIEEVGERSLADLRQDTYGRLIRLPMAFFAQRRRVPCFHGSKVRTEPRNSHRESMLARFDFMPCQFDGAI